MEPNLDDQLVHDYLAECQEHLTTIENDLLAMEQAGAEIDEQLVNRVFRAAHSIKGGAGFFGLTVIRGLAHKTENVLDLIRSRQIAPNPEIVSILLLAFDKLRELVADYTNSNRANIDEFVTALTAVAEAQMPEAHKQLLAGQVALHVGNASRVIQVSAFDLNQARRGGKWIYLIRYDLLHDFDQQGKTPLATMRTLMKYGTILETGIDLESAGSLEEASSRELAFEILYATVLERDLIGELVAVKGDQILVIEKNGSVQPLGSPSLNSPAEDSPAADFRAPEPSAGTFSSVEAEAAVTAGPSLNTTAPNMTSPSMTPASTAPASAAAGAPMEATVRLNVALLDTLMTLAGELVLGRNELSEAVAKGDQRGVKTAAHRLSLVTSDLQETVALTRMQPVGTVFAKFPRLVRELSRELGKDVQMKVEGGEVELDKTIMEGLSDPLTHMVRNAVDHGLEPREQRVAAGKEPTGTVKLRARHQAGQVVIEIADDGRGLSAERIAASCVKKGLITSEQAQSMSEAEKLALIFLPGSSTAEKISDVSGRGVGMDVVKTNLDRLGGKIEIESVLGKGAAFRIKLPLTLAIMPSLLVSEGAERFAIPQTSVRELIRVPVAQRAQRVDRVGDAQVLGLRDRLVPLLHLAGALGMEHVINNIENDGSSAERAWNIVLVDTGTFEYGLVVEELHDTVEIVVKPLGRHLQGLRVYAGATILGDGHVAPILDVEGLAARAGLTQLAAAREENLAVAAETSSFLLFHNAPAEPCALPIGLITRIESVRPSQIERLGGRRTLQYRNASLPLVALEDIAAVGRLEESQDWKVIVVERRLGERRLGEGRLGEGRSGEQKGGSFGLLAAGPLDMIESALAIDGVTLRQRGVAGSAILNEKTTLILDIAELAEAALRGPCEAPRVAMSEAAQSGVTASAGAGFAQPGSDDSPGSPTETTGQEETRVKPQTILIAEDSAFFRGQIQRLIEAVGYQVLPTEDGQAAWEMLNRHAGEVAMVVTDVEMPRLGGLGLARKIREDTRFAKLPVIALSTLAGEEQMAEGLAAGVSEYQVKLDQDQLLDGIRRALKGESR